MRKTITMADVLELSPAERIQLVEDIWDSLAAAPDAITLSDEQKAELDHRLDAARSAPAAEADWSDVLSRLRSKA